MEILSHLSSGISLDVFASRHHDEADGAQEGHEDKTFNTAPDVDDFCNGKLGDTANDTGQNAGG